jgi:hypothetical protein
MLWPLQPRLPHTGSTRKPRLCARLRLLVVVWWMRGTIVCAPRNWRNVSPPKCQLWNVEIGVDRVGNSLVLAAAFVMANREALVESRLVVERNAGDCV